MRLRAFCSVFVIAATIVVPSVSGDDSEGTEKKGTNTVSEKELLEQAENKGKVDQVCIERFPVETKLSLGDVELGKRYAFAIELINRTSQTLEISDVKSSCGCTVAVPSAKEIPGGKSVVVRLLYRAKTTGEKNQTVAIEFDKIPSRTLQLRITASAMKRYSVAVIQEAIDGTTDSLALTVRDLFPSNERREPEIVVQGKAVAAESVKTHWEGDVGTVTVELKSEKFVDWVSHNFVVTVDGGGAKQEEVVIVSNANAIEVRPVSLFARFSEDAIYTNAVLRGASISEGGIDVVPFLCVDGEERIKGKLEVKKQRDGVAIVRAAFPGSSNISSGSKVHVEWVRPDGKVTAHSKVYVTSQSRGNVP